MDSNPTVTVNIHGSPMTAATHAETSAFILSSAAPYYNGSSVTFFCDDYVLARKLADAVNATISEHKAAVARANAIYPDDIDGEMLREAAE